MELFVSFKADQPCTACGLMEENSICFHHIYSQKAFPEYKLAKFNLMPLCLKHHNEVHQTGLRSFAVKYPAVKMFLVSNGYEFNEFIGKWIHIER